MELAAGRGHVARRQPAWLGAARARRRRNAPGFTFTALRPGTEEVIGCLYVYPANDGDDEGQVRSWVRAAAAELDGALHAAVSHWLAERWPLERAIYAERPLA